MTRKLIAMVLAADVMLLSLDVDADSPERFSICGSVPNAQYANTVHFSSQEIVGSWADTTESSMWPLLGDFRDRWEYEELFDEYMEVNGNKYPVVEKNVLNNADCKDSDSADAWWRLYGKAENPLYIPVESNTALTKDSITPVAVGGTVPAALVDLTVMTDAEMYQKVQKLTDADSKDFMLGYFYPKRSARSNRLWIRVGVKADKSRSDMSSVTVEVDVANSPAAGGYSHLTKAQYAAIYGVNNLSGTVVMCPATWFQVGIKETGEVFPTPIYVHTLVYGHVKGGFANTKKFVKDFMDASDTIDEHGGNGEAVVCQAAWYVSPQENGAVEVVARPDDVRKGSVSGNGVYLQGSEVTLTARPAAGCEFVEWSDGVKTATRTVSVSGDAEYVARFDGNGLVLDTSHAGEVNTSFAKAQSSQGALCDAGGNVVGAAQVKVGKINGKGQVKITATATLMDGKKVNSKALTLNVGNGEKSGKLVFKGIGEMSLELADDGTFTLKSDGYAMADANVGGDLPNGTMTFTVDIDSLPDFGTGMKVLESALPNGTTVAVSGKKLDAGKAASPKYQKFKDKSTGATWYELAGLDDPSKPNVSGLKLSYTPKTGAIKGSFKIYATNEDTVALGKKPALKKFTVNINGFMINGKGVLQATMKKPAASWSARLE